MKIKGKDFKKMKADVLSIVDSIWGREFVARTYAMNPVRVAHDLWWRVCMDRTQDDSHPRFKEGAIRFLSYDPDFEIYPCGSNDEHIYTAMKKILNEL